jgi:putative Mg2+ transporter-C (MgtC) family protein
MLDAVFVTFLLVCVNIVLRPLSRYIDQRSLSLLETHTVSRLRLICAADHQADAEFQIARAIASRSLVLRELRAERIEDKDKSIVQAVIESSTRDPTLLEKLASELRAFPWTESVEWTEIESE